MNLYKKQKRSNMLIKQNSSLKSLEKSGKTSSRQSVSLE